MVPPIDDTSLFSRYSGKTHVQLSRHSLVKVNEIFLLTLWLCWKLKGDENCVCLNEAIYASIRFTWLTQILDDYTYALTSCNLQMNNF